MNTTKKIAIALAVMIVAATAAPAVMGDGDVGYTATIGAGQNTVLTVLTGAFGTVSTPSTDNHVDDTFKLNNNGNKAAQVKAKFTTNVSDVYGLTNASNVIGGSNFSLRADDDISLTNDTLNDLGTDVTLTYQVPDDGQDHNYDAWLDVPSLMDEGTYAGNVRLTFVTA